MCYIDFIFSYVWIVTPRFENRSIVSSIRNKFLFYLVIMELIITFLDTFSQSFGVAMIIKSHYSSYRFI